MTTKTTPAKKVDKNEEVAKVEQPKRTTTKASDHFEPVLEVLQGAGPEGLTLAELSDLTGISPRVLHNVLYRLGKAEKARRIQEVKGKRVRYASLEVKATPAPRKRAPRKSTAAKKKATTKAA